MTTKSDQASILALLAIIKLLVKALGKGKFGVAGFQYQQKIYKHALGMIAATSFDEQQLHFDHEVSIQVGI